MDTFISIPAPQPRAAPSPGFSSVGRGDPVVMLHGSLGSKSQWRALADRLASRHRAIAVDLHGYGDNAQPRFRWRHRFGHEVALVLRRLEEARCGGGPLHLVGHSFGAGVALEFARLHPHRVASLALYEPPCFPLLPVDDVDFLLAHRVGAAARRDAAAGRLDAVLRGFLDYWAGAGYLDALPEELRRAFLARAPKLALDFEAVFAAATEWRGIEAPTLLLRGRRSPRGVQRAVQRLAGMLPRARLQDLPGDHLMPVREPQPVNEAIAAFLQALANGDARGAQATR